MQAPAIYAACDFLHLSASKARFMVILDLRTLLIHGARSVVYRASQKTDRRGLWIARAAPA